MKREDNDELTAAYLAGCYDTRKVYEQRLAAAEAKIPRWIPVSEGLPPPIGRSPSVYGSEWVIASYRWNGAVFIGECRFVHGPKQAWKTSNDDYDIEVTHWMPLPEAPESGSEGE